MTMTYRGACRSASPRITISELVERGLRRNRLPPLAIAGPPFGDADGNTVSFSLALVEGRDRIAAVVFCASSCATLIAYCEFVAEIAPGLDLEIAQALTATGLVALVPGVPALKRDRAVIAAAAFVTALARARVLSINGRRASAHD